MPTLKVRPQYRDPADHLGQLHELASLHLKYILENHADATSARVAMWLRTGAKINDLAELQERVMALEEHVAASGDDEETAADDVETGDGRAPL